MTMWNNVILCLGSNTDCEANLKSAASLLRAYFGSIRFSEAIYTEPIGLPDSGLLGCFYIQAIYFLRYECFAGRGEAGCEGDGKTIGTHVGQ